MSLVVAKRFDNYIEAHLIKSKLESEEILCFLFDEQTMNLNPIYNQALGGIRLMVRPEDLIRVTRLIREWETRQEEGEKVHCPKCQSTALYHNYKSVKGIIGTLALMVSIWLSIYPYFYRVGFKCKNCGNLFNSENSGIFKEEESSVD